MKGKKVKVKKLALVDPELLSHLLKTSRACAQKVLRPPKTRKVVKKRKKTPRRSREDQINPFLPGGALSDPEVDRAVRLRADLDREIQPGSGGRRRAPASSIGAAATLDRRRNRTVNLLADLMVSRRRIRRAAAGVTPAVPPPMSDEDVSEGEEEVSDSETITDDTGSLSFVSEVLPKSVLARAKALLKMIKSERGRLGWNPVTKELTVRGRRVPGTNILDLVTHVTRDRLPRPSKTRPSPGPPPGFEEFARGLREINVPRELLKNRRRWREIFGGVRRKLISPGPVGTPTSRPFESWESFR